MGPYIGGYFSTHYSEQFASGVAGTGCIIAIAIIWMFVPKSTGRIQANNVDVTKDHMGDEGIAVSSFNALSEGYSGTSDSGLSQIGIQYDKPLYKGHSLR